MTSSPAILKRETWFWLLIATSAFVLIILLPSLFVYHYYQDHFLPQTTLNQIDISNLDYLTALEQIETLTPPPDFPITLYYQEQQLASPAAQLGFHYQFDQVLQDNLARQQQLSPWQLVSQTVISLFQPQSHLHQYQYDLSALQEFVTAFQLQIEQPSTPAALALGRTNRVETLEFTQGQDGLQLLPQTTLDQLQAAFSRQEWTIPAAVHFDQQTLTSSQIDSLLATGEKLVGQRINWVSDQRIPLSNFRLTDQDLISCLSPLTATPNSNCLIEAIQPLHELVDREPVEPIFEYNPETLAVLKFQPPQDGLTFNQAATTQNLFTAYDLILQTDTATQSGALDAYSNSLLASAAATFEPSSSSPNYSPDAKTVTLQLDITTKPPITSLAQTNNLGINELIGFGESYYAGSIAGRVHNVKLSADRISGYILPPGKEFSFNQRLGDVSGATGYQPGYVIQGGRSVLSDGGGVCQTSSTLFRALLDSGVKVTRRLPHSYRVSYYELNNDPGFDATVYSGNVDLRFVNDTPGHILIYMTADSQQLYMTAQLYGTSDGRTTEVVDYHKYGATPAPATQYIEDPSLAPGQRKQIDWATPGLKVSYTNIIRDRQGQEIRRDQYQSNYQAWSAKYLVGPGTQ